jgi:hypothetical protein
MLEWTRESLAQAAKELAENGQLSMRDFLRRAKVNDYHIYKLFPKGGWTELRELAGIQRHPLDKDSLTDEELLTEFHRVTSELGTIPTWHRFASLACVGPDTIKRRFGGSQGVLQRYRSWLENKHPNSPLLAEIDLRLKHELATPDVQQAVKVAGAPKWEKRGGIEYGAPINFRGLRHAPINEQGVVYLFGVVSSELGLIVESIQSAYPDCEAKRCVDAKQNRWQRVRIEFEFRSKNFLDHGHDPNECDVIVCWEHDWPDRPVEVIELRTIINNLEA